MQGPTLRVRLLGGLEIRLGDEPVPPFDSARAESLLTYLLLRRTAPQPRQRLAFLLWPDSTEPQARTNLRQVLHTLRRALPDADRFIDVGPRTLQWRSDAKLWLDVAAFEQAVADGRLQEAADTYTGELLEGSYDEWLFDERDRLAQLSLDVLDRLARQLEEQGRWGEAGRYAERLLRQDPLREETYRLLMRLHDTAGDGARALRVYHECATTLQRELGIEPSAATRQAYEALLRAGPESQERGPASLAGPPLVGRSAERAHLAALWRASERGAAQLVLVTGEPGVGKSRLVEELQSWCAHHGAVIAQARAYPAEGAMAYGMAGAWLRSEPIAARLRRLDRARLTELAQLLPELLAEVPGLPGPEPLGESEHRQRLFGALAPALFAAGTPLLLIADDLHWCDVQTLQFLHYLLRSEPDARLLVAATARREEIDVHHPVSELISALHALGRISEIALGRLSREETGALADRIAAKPLAPTDADRLYGDSEGNPLFIVEALWANPEGAATPDAGVSSRVQAVLTARLAQLSEPAGELVGVAATIGREFTTQLLADASGADEQAFVRGLDELWRRGLVRAQGPGAYDFSHGRIREAAYRALSPAQARHHHLRVAEAVQRSHAAGLDAVSGQIAAHYDAAGEPKEAVSWYVRAADASQRLHANADAVHALERALLLTNGLPAGSERATLQLRLLTALPAPLVAVEDYLSERLALVHERALRLAGELGAEPEAPIVWSLALASLTRGDFEAARASGEQLRLRAEQDGDEVLWVESAYILGVSTYWLGRLEEARAHLEAAVERCRPEQRGEHLLRYGQDPELFCLLRLAHTLWMLGRHAEAESRRDTALALSEQSAQPYSRAVVWVWAAIVALDQRDETRLRLHVLALESALAEAPRQVRVVAEAFAGHVEVLDGLVERGIARVRRALDDACTGEAPAPGVPGIVARTLLESYATAGAHEAGLSAADAALGMGRGAELWEAEIRRLRAEFLAGLGADRDDVEAELRRAIAVAQGQGARTHELRAQTSLADFRAERPAERS